MASEILLFDGNIIYADNVVGIEEKKVTFSVKHTKKNPQPKPSGFFARLSYSDTIVTYTEESYYCWILKVKGSIQKIKKTDDEGRETTKTNQLYDFYTIYNDKKLIDRVREDIQNGSTDKVCEIGNFFCYFGMLNYPDYIETNTLYDGTVRSKKDVIEKYLM